MLASCQLELLAFGLSKGRYKLYASMLLALDSVPTPGEPFVVAFGELGMDNSAEVLYSKCTVYLSPSSHIGLQWALTNALLSRSY